MRWSASFTIWALNNNEVTDDTVSSGATLGGRIHLYKGDHSAGAEISASTPLETALMGGTSTTPLGSYDMVMFPCQGSTTAESAAYIDNLLAYTSAGGRAFVTHDSRVVAQYLHYVSKPDVFRGRELACQPGVYTQPRSRSGYRQHQLYRRIDSCPMAVQRRICEWK